MILSHIMLGIPKPQREQGGSREPDRGPAPVTVAEVVVKSLPSCACIAKGVPLKSCDHASLHPPATSARRLSRFVVPGVLLLLSEGDTYGYDLGSKLAELGFIENEKDTALVYRALRSLSAQGSVTVREEPGQGGPPRRVYALTPVGRVMLEEWRNRIEERVGLLLRFLRRCPVSDCGRKEASS
jgi:DNA-binding PadR family transcriptional regulator